MSVRKRKWITRSGEAKEAWVVDYAQDGQRHIETFARKKDAVDYAGQVGVDIKAGTHTAPSRSITVEEAAEDWVKAVQREGRERSTLDQYRQHAVHINSRIGPVKLAKLTAPMVNKFRDELLDSGMSRQLARKVLSSLKSLLKDAQRSGSVAQNVALSAKRIEPNKRGDNPLTAGVDMPTPGEVKALIEAMPDHWRPLLLTAIFTGLRASELRGLQWTAVDFQSGKLHVRQRADRYQQIGDPKSKAGHREVPIPPIVLNTLREWKLRCPLGELGLVFPNAYGGVARHNKIVAQFRRIVSAAGLVDAQGKPKYTGLHSLRHFYASWCINPKERGGQGLPGKVVQTLLGHSSIVMTMNTYGHLFPAGDDAEQRLAEAERALLS